MRKVTVDVASGSYEVQVGGGARRLLSEVLPPQAEKVVVLTQSAVPWEVDPGSGREWRSFELPPGESAKTLSTVEEVCREMVRFGLSRRDVVVGVGGGAVTDVAGLVAAVYHRGIAVVHVPTTLLGQIDAAIGGKCGVNLPEGKNLVGAFWQPSAVLCDTDVLSSLPEREWRSGLGEMAKYAFLGVEDLDDLSLEEQVAACVAHKAAVVGSDERESGMRATLNYGHTLGHALEAASLARGEDLRHGEGVAIGLAFAARLAERLGRIDDQRVLRHFDVLRKLDLPEALPLWADEEELLSLMARDKKASMASGLTFVLDSPGGVEVVSSVDAKVVADVLGSHPRQPVDARWAG